MPLVIHGRCHVFFSVIGSRYARFTRSRQPRETPTMTEPNGCLACTHEHDPATAGDCAAADCLPSCEACRPPHVRLNGTRTVHIASIYRNAEGEQIIAGRACNQWPGGGHKRIRAEVTDHALTCKSCIRYEAARVAAMEAGK
jgi:hypothetical protein